MYLLHLTISFLANDCVQETRRIEGFRMAGPLKKETAIPVFEVFS